MKNSFENDDDIIISDYNNEYIAFPLQAVLEKIFLLKTALSNTITYTYFILQKELFIIFHIRQMNGKSF
jgi:hypothetical protein